jgi:hypothetical protein
MNTLLRAFIVAVVLPASLTGCAVYGPPPAYGYYESSSPDYPSPVYAYPAPVIVQPAPVYIGPPVWFGLNFQYRSGHRHGGGRRHFR